MSREQTDLLPCPFCGREDSDDNPMQESAIVVDQNKSPAGGYYHTARCCCGGRGPSARTQEQASEAWNRRAAPTVSGGEGWEELEAIVERSLPAAWVPGLGSFTYGQLSALIAVARGGFSALQASPSVPTEGHGAAVVDDHAERVFRQAGALNNGLPGSLDYEAEKLFRAQYPDRDYWSIRPDVRISWHRKAWAETVQNQNSKLGGYFAQQNEPNPLPTVQAETAVVGDALARFELLAEFLLGEGPMQGRQFGEPGPLTEDGKWRRNYWWRDEVRAVRNELRAALQQAPVSTGEQPGMSEANALIALSASNRACYDYPGVDQVAERTAFVAGAEAYASITLPDDLLSLSEAATQGEWEASGATGGDGEYLVTGGEGDEEWGLVATTLTETDAKLAAASVNFIRTLAAKQGGKPND